MRRADGARAHDHFAPCAHFMHLTAALIGDADSLPSTKDDPRRLGLCHELEVGAALAQIGGCRRFTKAAARGDLIEPYPFDGRAIEIGIKGKTRFLRGGDEDKAQRMSVAVDGRDMERPTAAMPVAGAEIMVLELAVDLKHVAPAPALIAQSLPIIEIGCLAARIDHGIDRARTSQHFAARPIADAPGKALDGLGLIHPVDTRVVEGSAIANGHPDPEPTVIGTRLEQQYAVPAAFA